METFTTFSDYIRSRGLLCETFSASGVRRLCLKAGCHDLIRGMGDAELDELGKALGVYADVGVLSRLSYLNTRDSEKVRARIAELVARGNTKRDTMGLRTASLLAQADEVVPEAPAGGFGEVKVGSYDTSHQTTHAHLVDPTAAERHAYKSGRENANLQGKVASARVAREVPVALVKAEALRRGVRWDTLIAADHSAARAGMDPLGGRAHAYPFYYKDGFIYRFEPEARA